MLLFSRDMIVNYYWLTANVNVVGMTLVNSTHNLNYQFQGIYPGFVQCITRFRFN